MAVADRFAAEATGLLEAASVLLQATRAIQLELSRRVLLAVAELHRLGYQRVRIAPSLGMAWRCTAVPSSRVLRANGAVLQSWNSRDARYTSAVETMFSGWENARSDTPLQLAYKVLDRFPVLRSEGLGEDYTYVGWYIDMLRLTRSGALPIAFGGEFAPAELLARGYLGTVGPPPIGRIPFPPNTSDQQPSTDSPEPLMPGRTIKLFLVDGQPTGVIAAEVMGWTGMILVAPRTQLRELKKRDRTQGSGVYLLVGPDPDLTGKSRVYIGESDNVIGRILQHDRDESKDYYDKALLIISKDEQLTKSHARYLETAIIGMAKSNGSAILTNDTKGSTDVRLPESDRADMQNFLEHVQIVLPVLGFPFTQPKLDLSLLTTKQEHTSHTALDALGQTPPIEISPEFVLSVVGAFGHAREVSGQLYLLKGSTARKIGVPTWVSYKSLRDQLVAEGKLVDHPTDSAYYVAPEDIAFSSPSGAAAIVAGRSVNGRQGWKVVGTGQTYQDWAENRIASEPNDTSGTQGG